MEILDPNIQLAQEYVGIIYSNINMHNDKECHDLCKSLKLRQTVPFFKFILYCTILISLLVPCPLSPALWI